MKIFKDYDLTAHNSYEIEAKCARTFFPEIEQDFVDIYTNYSTDKPKIVLGGGNNIIFSKEYYEEDFIMIKDNFSSIVYEQPGIIMAQAGANTVKLCEFALEMELSGAEIFYDIPSTLGGAVIMNAGASGEEIKDILVKVTYLDLIDCRIKEMDNIKIGFHYRNSFFQKNTDKIVLKIWLQLHPGNKVDIKNKMEEIKKSRWLKQPRNYPNAGSVFKRPKGFYVGALIEELGLKGFTIGGAKISEKHGGFIINFNKATGKDILEIIKEAKRRVFEKYKIDLEIEQRII